MEKIRWGVLSTGKIAHKFAQALQATADSELYAVSSRSEEKAEAFAAQYGFEKHYGSTEEMLADKNVQVVYIGSPMSCHYEDAIKCLMAGKNVLCEKTVTLCTEQLDDILKLAAEKKLFFMEAMWTKTLPHFLQAKRWFEEGRIGRIKMIKSDFVNMCEGDLDDRLFRSDLGGGALLDLGVYPLTFTQAFLGSSPESITAYAHMKNDIDYDDAVILKYHDAIASMTFGFDCKSENAASVVGEEGVIVFDSWFHCSEKVSLYDKNNRLIETKNFPHPRTGYEYEIIEVNRCLRSGLTESPLVPHSGTREVMVMIDRIKKKIGLSYPDENCNSQF